MGSSNFNITKVTVDPTSQEITNLENGNPDPNAEAVDAVASYDTESLLPLITNVWTGSSSYSKRDILDYHLSSTEDYYVYKVSTIGTYPYLKEVD